MYLATKSTFQLDKVIKSFEVGFRSYIANEFLQTITSEAEFILSINELKNDIAKSSFLLSKQYKQKIRNIEENYKQIFQLLKQAKDSCDKKCCAGEVPYVSTVIDLFVLYYQRCFSKSIIVRNFSSADEILYSINNYHRIRNTLSHPGSKQISIVDGLQLVRFISKLTISLNDRYFWFSTKKEILSYIDLFASDISERIISKDNLKSLPTQHKALLCRDEELNRIHDCIIGRDSYQRIAGSLVIYGYGGVGKTALVIEFILRLVKELIDTKNSMGMDFILFFSSKEEYLKRMETTGEIYIEKADKQIDSFQSLEKSMFDYLGIQNIEAVSKSYRRGIVVIDNIENLSEDDRSNIFQLIRRTPRNVQYIITSRNEEQCEEKLHIEEYRDEIKGINFINEFIKENDDLLQIDDLEKKELISVSKGNTLILVQALNSISNGVNTAPEIIASLETVKTKQTEIIADFMYKNTFDNALRDLEKRKYNPRDVIIHISLYKEPIDLYSISKLCKIDIGTSNEICNHLSKCLILIKNGEYYSLNEFASNFIFIKMMPDRFQMSNLQSKVANHKAAIKQKLESLQNQISGNSQISEIMNDWKPRNYIDKIIIADCFSYYHVINDAIRKRDHGKISLLLAEYRNNELITTHPYVQFQKARLLKKIVLSRLEVNKKDYFNEIERAYEDVIESIEYSYPFIKGTTSHGAALMLFGISLLLDQNDASRSIRYLENAREIFEAPSSKVFFDCRYYLISAYTKMHNKTNDRAYSSQRKKVVDEICAQKENALRYGFNFRDFENSVKRNFA